MAKWSLLVARFYICKMIIRKNVSPWTVYGLITGCGLLLLAAVLVWQKQASQSDGLPPDPADSSQSTGGNQVQPRPLTAVYGDGAKSAKEGLSGESPKPAVGGPGDELQSIQLTFINHNQTAFESTFGVIVPRQVVECLFVLDDEADQSAQIFQRVDVVQSPNQTGCRAQLANGSLNPKQVWLLTVSGFDKNDHLVDKILKRIEVGQRQ